MLMIFFIVECEIDFDYNNYIKPPIGHEFYVVIFLNILDLAEMRGLLRLNFLLNQCNYPIFCSARLLWDKERA